MCRNRIVGMSSARFKESRISSSAWSSVMVGFKDERRGAERLPGPLTEPLECADSSSPGALRNDCWIWTKSANSLSA